MDQSSRLKGFVPQPRGRRGAKAAAPSPAPTTAADKAAANGSGGAGAAEAAAGPSRGRRSSWSSGRRSAAGEDADEYEVPFGPAPSGLAAARASETSQPAHNLEVSLLRIAARGTSLPGSFYDGGGSAADVAAAAAASAAAAAVSSALAGVGASKRPGSLHSGSFTVGDGEEEVETLFSQEPGKAATDFDAAWQQNVAAAARTQAAAPSPATAAAAAAADEVQHAAAAAAASAAAASASAAASQAAARMVMQRIGAVALHRQAAASRGSTRDLLGRLQREESAAAPPSVGPVPSGQQGVSAALLTRAPSKVISQALVRARSGAALGTAEAGAVAAAGASASTDLEAGLGGGPAGESPKHASGSERGTEEGSEGGLSDLQDQRLRVLNGLKRHFRAKRLAGLLSPDGLRIAM